MLFDSHAHLDDERFADDLPAVIERAKAVGVGKIITIGTNMQSSARALSIADEYTDVFAAVGVHPHDAKDFRVEDGEQLIAWAGCDKVVAIGEIGLDYHYDYSPREVQKAVLVQQMEIAAKVNLPVIIHNREAHADTLVVLKEFAGKIHGVLHCYSGSKEMLREIISLGYYVSVAGPVTFNNADKLRQVVAEIPLQRLLLETDCPYLAPIPWRGKRNEPAYVKKVAERVAEIKKVSISKLIEQVFLNTERLFTAKIQNSDMSL